jgi:NTP pyrophosphatase (non-canonical NTP hydrolase)
MQQDDTPEGDEPIGRIQGILRHPDDPLTSAEPVDYEAQSKYDLARASIQLLVEDEDNGFARWVDIVSDFIGGWNVVQGFWDDYRGTPNEILAKHMLIVTEIAEASEGVRKNTMDEHCPQFTSEEVELADAFIRIMDLAGVRKLRLGGAIKAKLRYNLTRPRKHGKAC